MPYEVYELREAVPFWESSPEDPLLGRTHEVSSANTRKHQRNGDGVWGKKEKDIFECNGKEAKGTGVRKMGSKSQQKFLTWIPLGDPWIYRINKLQVSFTPDLTISFLIKDSLQGIEKRCQFSFMSPGL